MKYYYLVLLALFTTACNRPNRIEVEGTAPGIKSGVFGIVDIKNKPVYGDNIVNGKFKINELLEYAGYYNAKVTDMLNSKAVHIPYEIYLENGKYTIEVNGADLTKYPKIITESKIQNELSAYYTLADELLGGVQKEIKERTEFLRSDKASQLPGDQYVDLVDKLKAARDKEKEIEASLIEKFVEKFPQTSIAPHLILQLDYKNDPVRYHNVFTKLTDEAKNSDEGKRLNASLTMLVKLVPGGTAPQIYGTTPDGKSFDPKSVSDKKIILIDFWRAGNEVSRANHKLIIDNIFFQVNNKKAFGVISIDMDEKRDWWVTAIKEDKMNWPQYSDLKGNDSQNAAAWGITRVPSYYLVDGNWKIIKRDVAFDDVAYIVTEYLGK